MDIIVRIARLTDAPELASLCTELGYPATPEDIERRLPRLLSDNHHVVLVAADGDDRAVGWLHGAIRPQITSDPFVQVEGLVVTASRRSAGVGARLLAEAEAWALQRAVREMRVRSNIVRDRAHRFYLRSGYVLAKTSHLFVKRLA